MIQSTIWRLISEWAQSADVSDWQSDTFRRIYETGKLSESDFQQIGLLLKAENGVSVPLGGLKAIRYSSDNNVVADSDTCAVQLISMGSLTNVNAINSEETLEFQQKGLTIVYGPNGSGKSGYSRVLKRACYARDSYARVNEDEQTPSPIIPNVHMHRDGLPATAKFVLNIDGEEHPPIDWKDGERLAKKLNITNSPIAVFDSHAANVYVIKDNEIPFAFYGFDIMEKLAEACKNLRNLINDDIAAAREKLKTLWEFSNDPTIGKFIKTIQDGKISPDFQDIKNVDQIKASFSDKDRKRLEYLRDIFKEQNPAEKAKSLRADITRISKWNQDIDACMKTLIDDIHPRLREAIDGFEDAKSIAQGKMDKFDKPKPIDGSGGILWDALFTMAEKFSKEPYPDHEFPDVEKCVLCQRPLSEDSKRQLLQLKEFVRQGAGKTRDEKEKEVKAIYGELQLRKLDVSNLLTDFSVAAVQKMAMRVGGNFAGLHEDIRNFLIALVAVKKQLLKSAETFEWKTPSSLSTEPVEKITLLCASAEKIAADLENRAGFQLEKEALEAKNVFETHYHSIVDWIGLWHCYKDADSGKVSLKKKKLTEQPLNDELIRALRNEMTSLGMDTGNMFSTKPRQDRAVQKAQIQLNTAGDVAIGTKLEKILSEGEHRIIALASFFAELSLSPDFVSSIVLDDPISSLDHRRAHLVVNRLKKEAGIRQVIVFTHDLFFSNLFRGSKFKKIGLRAGQNTQGDKAFGFVGRMPFEGIKAEARINILRKEAKKIRKKRQDDQEDDIRHRYEDIRVTIEHMVEVCLLNGTVTRRFPDVKMGCLTDAYANPEKKEQIAHAMKKLHDNATRCSHSTPPESAGTPPDIEQFENDIEELDKLRKMLSDCGNED